MAQIYRYNATGVKADSGTLANFKSWAKPISDVLGSNIAGDGFGWTRAYSHAEVIARSGGAGSFAVGWADIDGIPVAYGDLFEVWQMSDSAYSATAPFFMRVDYYANGSQSKIRVNFGTVHATGVLSNDAEAFIGGAMEFNPNDVAGTYNHFFGGSQSSFRMALFADTNATDKTAYMAIERSKSSNGSDTDRYITAALIGEDTNDRLVVCPQNTFGSTVVSSIPYVRWVLVTGNNSATYGSQIGILPIIPVLGSVSGPLMNIGMIVNNDVNRFSNCSEATVSTYGGTRTVKLFTTGKDVNSNYIVFTYDASNG